VGWDRFGSDLRRKEGRKGAIRFCGREAEGKGRRGVGKMSRGAGGGVGMG
jgi:hypothetical protein